LIKLAWNSKTIIQIIGCVKQFTRNLGLIVIRSTARSFDEVQLSPLILLLGIPPEVYVQIFEFCRSINTGRTNQRERSKRNTDLTRFDNFLGML